MLHLLHHGKYVAQTSGGWETPQSHPPLTWCMVSQLHVHHLEVCGACLTWKDAQSLGFGIKFLPLYN